VLVETLAAPAAVQTAAVPESSEPAPTADATIAIRQIADATTEESAAPEAATSRTVAAGTSGRMVQVVEATRGGPTADWLAPAGSSGTSEDLMSEAARSSKPKAADKIAANDEKKDKNKGKAKDAKTDGAKPAQGKDKDTGSGEANAGAQAGKDKDGPGDGGKGGKGEGGKGGGKGKN
jgi:hypothetical protein